jgi:flagellar biosynthesis/type III secretory pathway protein FliH
MKYLRIPLVILAAVAMTSWATVVMQAANPQAQSTALERGYRTGYSDGYNAGYRDVSDQAARNHQAKEEFQQADRNYNQVWGPIEDYRDGYQQGFETGYAAGYDRRWIRDREPFLRTTPRRALMTAAESLP